MSRPWTVVSINRKNGETIQRRIMSGYNESEVQPTFSKAYPSEDLLAAMPGEIHVVSYDSPMAKARATATSATNVDPFELPTQNSS